MGALNVLPARSAGLMSLIQAEFPGYHPLLSIARIAHTEQDKGENGDMKLQFECHRVIAKYVEPELKSLEVKPPPDEHRRVKVSLFEIVDAEYTQIPQSVEG